MKSIRSIAAAVLLFGALAGCSHTSAVTTAAVASDPLSSFLAGLSNKATSDLQTAVKVASVQVTDQNGTHAMDPAGVTCGNSLLAVQGQVNAVVAAAKGGGVVTGAEIASVLLPGTPQTDAIKYQIVSGCSVKVAQATNAIAGGAVWFSALAQAFQIAAPLAAAIP